MEDAGTASGRFLPTLKCVMIPFEISGSLKAAKRAAPSSWTGIEAEICRNRSRVVSTKSS